MDDPRLLTLCTLVRIKNYTKTAKRLFITQPAVTHHIQSLEKEYDIKIFSDSKNFTLSSQGKIMVEYARRMINQSRLLEITLEKSKDEGKKASFAITSSVSFLLKKDGLLSFFLKQFKDEVRLSVESLPLILAKLQEGQLDFAIIDAPYSDDVYEGFLLDTASIVPVCNKEGKFKEIKRITREMLKNNPLIFGCESEGLCTQTQYFLKAANIHLGHTDRIYCQSYFLMEACIAAKDGIGFCYHEALKDMPSLKKMELTNFKAEQSIYLIYHQNSFEKAMLKELLSDLSCWKEALK